MILLLEGKIGTFCVLIMNRKSTRNEMDLESRELNFLLFPVRLRIELRRLERRIASDWETRKYDFLLFSFKFSHSIHKVITILVISHHHDHNESIAFFIVKY